METIEFIDDVRELGLDVERKLSPHYIGYDLRVVDNGKLLAEIPLMYPEKERLHYEYFDKLDESKRRKLYTKIQELQTTSYNRRGNNTYLKSILENVPEELQRIYKNYFNFVEEYKRDNRYGDRFADGWRVGEDYENYLLKVESFQEDLNLMERLEKGERYYGFK